MESSLIASSRPSLTVARCKGVMRDLGLNKARWATEIALGRCRRDSGDWQLSKDKPAELTGGRVSQDNARPKAAE